MNIAQKILPMLFVSNLLIEKFENLANLIHHSQIHMFTPNLVGISDQQDA